MTSPYRAPAERAYYAPDFDKKVVKELAKAPRSHIMRGISLYAVTSLLVAVGSVTVVGCSLFTPQNVNTALDVAKVACIIANAESSAAVVKTVCGILDAETPALQTILGEQRKASRRFASSPGMTRCADGGADASPDAQTSQDAGAAVIK